jgi:hypothetical protein
MAAHCGLTINKARAIVVEFGILDDSEAFREFRVGSSVHKRYSKKALDILRANRDKADEIWLKVKGKLMTKPRKPK